MNGRIAPWRLRAPRLHHRISRVEQLDDRFMLSAAPTVTGVHVAGTQWSSAFVGYLQSHSLGDHGFRIPVGSSVQAKTLPWSNINQVIVSFSEDVLIHAADLSITGVNVPHLAFADFFYDAFTHVATWTLAQPLPTNVYRLDLDGDGSDRVIDLEGNALDGEWTNNSSVYASGNGVAGGDFEFTFKVLPGDVNQSNYVEYFDYYAANSRQGLSTTSSNYLAFADVNGSGTINSTDTQSILNALWATYPSGSPAGASGDAPSAPLSSRSASTTI